MKIDLSEVNNISITADFTVVGGGTVGLLIASELARELPEHKIVVIESGYEFSETSEVFDVEFRKSRYAGASEGRFRCLGGTSNRWGGAMIPIMKEDWNMVDLGFDLSELDKYESRLEEIFGLEAGSFLGSEEEAWLGADYIPRLGKWPSFKKRNTKNVFASYINKRENLVVYLNSHVVGFKRDPFGVIALGSNRSRLDVASSNVILCAGAIESTRLAIKYCEDLGRTPPAKLGKNFSDHLALTIGNIKIRNRRQLSQFNENFAFRFGKNKSFRNIRFEMSPTSEMRGRFPPHYLHFSWRPDPDGGFSQLRKCYQSLQLGRIPKLSDIKALAPFVGWLMKAAYWRFVKKRVLFDSGSTLHIDLLIEQRVPNENFISLSDARDCFDEKKVVIGWEVSRADLKNVDLIIENIEKTWNQLPIAGLADFEKLSESEIRASVFNNGGSYHPTGTTPLGPSSGGGCLDPNFYLYGSDKLQILSTSVFPTGGGANPTMMLLLMGLKCAHDHVLHARGASNS